MFCSVLFSCFAPHIMSQSPQLQSFRARLLGRRCSLCTYSRAWFYAASVSSRTVAFNPWALPGLPVAVRVTWKPEPLSPFFLNVVNDLLGVCLAEYSYWSTLPPLLLIRNLGSGSLCQNLSVFQNQPFSALYLELSSSCIPS